MDWSVKYTELVKLYFSEVIEPILPNAKLASSTAMSSPDAMPEVFDLRIATSEMFHDSAYSVDRNCDYIHFTRLSSIERILRDKIILASSTSHLIDNDEVHYGFQKISNAENKAVEKAKDSTYILSLVEDKWESITDHYLWNIYGDLGKGGFLRFEVPLVKYPFSFGKVKYGLAELERVADLNARIQLFKDRHNLTAKDIEIVLLHIAACHKSKRFESEKEVRLIYSKDYEDFGRLQYLPTRTIVGPDGMTRKALEVPVRILSEGVGLVESPRTELVLKEIVLGYGIPDKELNRTFRFLMELLPKKPQVKISRLTKELDLLKLY
jgi:hypothetical protein